MQGKIVVPEHEQNCINIIFFLLKKIDNDLNLLLNGMTFARSKRRTQYAILK